MIHDPIQLSSVVRVTAIVVATHDAVTSLEHLSSRGRFHDDGLLAWSVSREYVRTAGALSPTFEALLRPPRFQALLVARLLAALSLVGVAALGRVPAALIGFLFLANVLIGVRHQAGLSGDFHMSTVTHGGLLVAVLSPPGSTAELIGILFIAAQCVLSYLVAGVAKLVSDEWRDGSAPVGIFSTEAWGHSYVYRALKAIPGLDLAAAWATISFESLFAIVLFVGPDLALVVLGVGILFHAFNAVFMGLNGFLLAWPATYPSVYYASQYLHQAGL